MKYYSEDLKKLFDSEDDLVAAEKKSNDERIAKEKKDKELKEARSARAEEIENLIKQRNELNGKINEKINQFAKDYGSFHYSFKDSNGWFNDILDLFYHW